MSHNSFSMGTLPMVLPKKIFSTRSDGTNFRDGIIRRRRPNLKDIDMAYKLCCIFFFFNTNLVSLNDRILRLHLCIEIARFAQPQRICLRLIYVHIYFCYKQRCDIQNTLDNVYFVNLMCCVG